MVMALAMFWRMMVFPERGGATIRPRCPLPMGEARSKHSRRHLFFGRLHHEPFLG